MICVLHLHSLESRRPRRVSCFSESCIRTTSLLLCRRLILFVLLEVLRCELSIDDEYINFKNYSTYLRFWFSIDLWLMGIYAYKSLMSQLSPLSFVCIHLWCSMHCLCVHAHLFMLYAFHLCVVDFWWEEFFKFWVYTIRRGDVAFRAARPLKKRSVARTFVRLTLKGKISKWYLPKFLFTSKFFHSLIFYYALFLCFLHSFAELIFV